MQNPRRFFRPTWAEVDLSAIVSNLARVRAKVGRKVKIMFVVKANAYGHDAALCARAAEKARAADWLGVSSVEEGVALRESGIKLPILVLGSLYPFESVLAAVAHDLTPIVASLDSARRLIDVAKRLRRTVSCHLKIDTGMGRIGASPEAAVLIARELAGSRAVALTGVFTHFASAEDDPAYTALQLRSFRQVLSRLQRDGVKLAYVHAANSAAILRVRAAHFNMVRPGLAAYGACPGFAPALTLKTKIVFIKTVQKGSAVSYGATWRAKRATRVATLPIGYGDGYPRALSNKGFALVAGRRVPVIGRVTMDQIMIDATDVPGARVGDDVVLLGRQGKEEISADELARLCGTISYEIFTSLSARVPRIEAAK